MKCPDCNNYITHNGSMTCKICGYTFTLDPNKSPYISDMFVKSRLDDLSAKGNYYFTFDQMLVKLILAIGKKKRISPLFGLIFILGFLVLTILFISSAPMFVSFLGFIFLFVFGAIFSLKPVYENITGNIVNKDFFSKLRGLLKYYLINNPNPKLVDGKRLQYNGSNIYQKELSDYAPEKILIVDRNDLADMLVMNRFHFENRVLVLSQSKYPDYIFKYYQECIQNFPKVPVYLIHDASQSGFTMKEKLIKDPEWMIKKDQVVDLGLSFMDIEKLKRPIWLPTNQSGNTPGLKKKEITPQELIHNGLRIPVGSIPSKSMLGTFAMALSMGYPLLSDELLQSREQYLDYSGGGYG